MAKKITSKKKTSKVSKITTTAQPGSAYFLVDPDKRIERHTMAVMVVMEGTLIEIMALLLVRITVGTNRRRPGLSQRKLLRKRFSHFIFCFIFHNF